jgi:HAD superfamily hydrolase (TIGR01509 family)
MTKITQLLFDCDNTLVLSEDLAFEACAEVANQVLEKHNIDKRYTGPQLCNEFVGMNFRGVMGRLQEMYGLELTPDEIEENVLKEEDQVIATLKAKAEPCEGCIPVLEKLAAEGKYGLAVVSSSALRRVVASLEKVGLDRFFPKEHLFSAATSLPVPTSKPDPAIYIHACKVLGKQPSECVAVEDSKSGTLSAVRAGIPVIGYDGSYGGEEKQNQMRAVLTETGAGVVMGHWAEFAKALEAIEAQN